MSGQFAESLGRQREYSRFRETTGAGDWVRSPLGGAGGSQIRRFLHFRSGRITRRQSCTATRPNSAEIYFLPKAAAVLLARGQ
jgi:hypothetical protein